MRSKLLCTKIAFPERLPLSGIGVRAKCLKGKANANGPGKAAGHRFRRALLAPWLHNDVCRFPNGRNERTDAFHFGQSRCAGNRPRREIKTWPNSESAPHALSRPSPSSAMAELPVTGLDTPPLHFAARKACVPVPRPELPRFEPSLSVDRAALQSEQCARGRDIRGRA